MKFFGLSSGSDLNMMRWVRTFPKPHSRIAGTGCHLPEDVVSNHDLAALVEAPERLKKRLPGLIYRTTEVITRRYAAAEESPSDLGVPAILQALGNAGRKLDDIDTLIYASTDMDQLEPATSNILQQKLGLRQVNSFDVKNACNSFLQAMNIGNSLIATGAAKCVVICAAELGSHFVNREVRDIEDLRHKMGGLTIGDAAAAFVLEPCTDGQGITEINLFNLGEYWPLCHVPHDTDWRKKNPRTIHGWFYLNMPDLARIVRPLTIQYFRQYREYRTETCLERDFTEHLDKIIPHQISRRLIHEIARHTQVDQKLLAITAHEFGNTGAGAIPLTFHRTLESGNLKLGSGQDVLLFGAASGLGMGHIRLRL